MDLKSSSSSLDSLSYGSTSRNAMLDLKLSSFSQDRVSTQQAPNGGDVANELPSNHHQRRIRSRSRDFKCKYCPGRFSTSQALGGHQNAHKQERARDKIRQAAGLAPYIPSPNNYSSYPPYFSMYNNNGGYNNNRSPLGVVKTNSMIQKPSTGGFRLPTIQGFRTGYGSTPAPAPAPAPQPRPPSFLGNSQISSSYDRLRMLNNNIRNDYSPFNNFNNLSRSLPTFGEGSAPHIGRGVGENSQRGGLHIGGGRLDKTKLGNSSSLDLSLKL